MLAPVIGGGTHAIGRAVLDVIQSRRSLREEFTDEYVPTEAIDEVILSGATAPSSKNAQPWRLHVLERGQALNEIANAVQFAKEIDKFVPEDPATGLPREWGSTVAESAQVLREVGVGIFIENTGEFSNGRNSLLNSRCEATGSGLIGYGLEMIGLGAMIENMWLSAHALGLGGVFMGDILVAEEEIKQRLRFSGDLVGVLALGYTAMQPRPKILKPDSVVYHQPVGEE